jgi:hypothetical protein
MNRNEINAIRYAECDRIARTLIASIRSDDHFDDEIAALDDRYAPADADLIADIMIDLADAI